MRRGSGMLYDKVRGIETEHNNPVILLFFSSSCLSHVSPPLHQAMEECNTMSGQFTLTISSDILQSSLCLVYHHKVKSIVDLNCKLNKSCH